jgi:hypothetical protein
VFQSRALELGHSQAIDGGPDSSFLFKSDFAENRKVSRNFQKFRGKSKSLLEDLKLPQKISNFDRKFQSSAERRAFSTEDSKLPSKN